MVYNHTAEGNHLGPTLSFKGIDNAAYYRLVEDDQRYYMDYTGTGNTLNVRHPHSLQLIMDSLRYWVTEMHVDGFRFDLASTLAREFYDVDRLSTFFELVQQDPVVSQVKLIAEPWDIGPGGYQVGSFPPQWTEWNGKYRDTVRDFWRGEPSLGEFASRLTGSADLYEHSGRRPVASINFVTAHDGFTLRDLVSYNEKHNEANGEDNNDGESHNRSWNHGVEGPTDDPEILALAPARSATSSPRCCSARACRCCCTATSSAAPSRATTTPTPRTPSCPGCTGTTPTSRSIEFTAAVAAAAPRAPDVPPQAVLHRRHGARARRRRRRAAQRHRVAAPRRPPDGGRRLGRAARRRSACTSTATASPGRDARGEQIVDDHFLLYFNADGEADGDAAARRVRRRLGRRHRHRRLRRRGRHASRRARRSRSRTAAWSCCASTASPRSSPTSRSPRRSRQARRG